MLLRRLGPLEAAVASTCSRTPLTCELAHAKPTFEGFLRRVFCNQADSKSGSDRMYDFFVDALIRTPVEGSLLGDEARSRRRSLSPGTLSIINDLDAKTSRSGAISLVNTAALGVHSRLQDDHGRRRRSCTPTRRRLFSISGDGKEENAKPAMKPPTILVYTASNPDLFQRIFASLRQILPKDIYTITHLTQKSLIADHWQSEKVVCVFLADTKTLGDLAWSKLQGYFIRSGKILFLCQNLLANLANCSSTKKQISLFRSALCNKQAALSFGKDFEQFLKKSVKTLGKTKEVSDTFHAKDVVEGYNYPFGIHKKKDQPLLLYMKNSENNASVIFSDATSDQLVTGGGSVLIADALQQLGIDIAVDAEEIQLTQGYMMCEPDRLTWSMTGFGYGEGMGLTPKIYVQPSDHVQAHPDLFPTASPTVLPVELVRRKAGFPTWVKFDSNLYFSTLKSKSFGKALLYIPVCESTMPISRSLSNDVPTFDGILMVAGHQTKAVGRAGNQWLCTDKGCAMYTFNFNIPLMSVLGQSTTFVQHILAVAVVDAVRSLVEVKDFQLSIKWPNDIYFGREFKIGGIIVSLMMSEDTMHCVIGSGLNVANSKPSVCINDLLPETSDQVLTVEEVLAEIMNNFEYNVNLFENSGKEAFLKRYYEYWLHTDEEVTVQNDKTGLQERVVIRGLDQHGYLEVQSKQSGKVFSVQDNGNTFDMMKGLIRPKQI